jgi:hypothetical protein
MELFHALQNAVGRYLHGDSSLQDLHYWLAERAQDIADEPFDAAATLSEAAWTALSQFGDGEIDETTLRSLLAVALQRAHLASTAFGQQAQTATNATSLTVELAFSAAPRQFESGSVPIPRSPTWA